MFLSCFPNIPSPDSLMWVSEWVRWSGSRVRVQPRLTNDHGLWLVRAPQRALFLLLLFLLGRRVMRRERVWRPGSDRLLADIRPAVTANTQLGAQWVAGRSARSRQPATPRRAPLRVLLNRLSIECAEVVQQRAPLLSVWKYPRTLPQWDPLPTLPRLRPIMGICSSLILSYTDVRFVAIIKQTVFFPFTREAGLPIGQNMAA